MSKEVELSVLMGKFSDKIDLLDQMESLVYKKYNEITKKDLEKFPY